MKPSISYCEHVLAESEYLSHAFKGTSRSAFLADETLKRAFVRSLEIIGEAVKQVPCLPRLLSSGRVAKDGRDAA